jgi:hypothetical protein
VIHKDELKEGEVIEEHVECVTKIIWWNFPKIKILELTHRNSHVKKTSGWSCKYVFQKKNSQGESSSQPDLGASYMISS